jgi:hypothetical protein
MLAPSFLRFPRRLLLGLPLLLQRFGSCHRRQRLKESNLFECGGQSDAPYHYLTRRTFSQVENSIPNGRYALCRRKKSISLSQSLTLRLLPLLPYRKSGSDRLLRPSEFRPRGRVQFYPLAARTLPASFGRRQSHDPSEHPLGLFLALLGVRPDGRLIGL